MLRVAMTPLPGLPYRVHRAAAKICYAFRELERKVMTRTRSGFISVFIVRYVCLLLRIKRQQPRLAPSGHAKRAQKRRRPAA